MPNHRAVALALSTVLTCAACSVDVRGDSIVLREEKRFTVAGPTMLTLRTFDGPIEVRSWDRNEVLVEIERRGNTEADAAELEVRAVQESGRIAVEATNPRNRDGAHFGAWRSPSVSLIVTVPSRITLEARTGDGPILVRDVAGAVMLETGDGEIRVGRIVGDVSARTGDGGIEIDEADGRVDLHTGDGSIDLRGRLDELRVQTGDGSVRVEVEPGSAMKDEWSIRTGDGRVALHLPAAFDADLVADSGDGAVSINGRRDRDRGRDDDDRGSLRARLGAGGRTVRIQSGDGAIEITTDDRPAAVRSPAAAEADLPPGSPARPSDPAR